MSHLKSRIYTKKKRTAYKNFVLHKWMKIIHHKSYFSPLYSVHIQNCSNSLSGGRVKNCSSLLDLQECVSTIEEMCSFVIHVHWNIKNHFPAVLSSKWMPASEKYLKFRMCELTRPPIFKTSADKKFEIKISKLCVFQLSKKYQHFFI